MKDGEDAKRILDEIHLETNQLKQMLEGASLTPLDPEEELKKTLEDLTAELARRTMQSSRIDDSEDNMFNHLRELYEFVEPGGFALAENIVDEMKKSEAISTTLEKLQTLVEKTIVFSEATLDLMESEERRRKQYPLRNSRDMKLAAEIAKLRNAEKKTWKNSSEFLQGLRLYAASVKSLPKILEDVATAVPSETDKEEPVKKFGRHIAHLYDAIHKLLDVCSPEMLELLQTVRGDETKCCESLLALINKMKQSNKAEKLIGLSGDTLEVSELMDNLENSEFEDADLRSQINYQKQLVLQKEEARIKEEKLLQLSAEKNLEESECARLIDEFEKDKNVAEKILKEEQMRQHERLRHRFANRRKKREMDSMKRSTGSNESSDLKKKHNETLEKIRMEAAEKLMDDMELLDSEEKLALEALEHDNQNSRTKLSVRQQELKDMLEAKLEKLDETSNEILNLTPLDAKNELMQRMETILKDQMLVEKNRLLDMQKEEAEKIKGSALSDELKKGLLDDLNEQVKFEIQDLEDGLKKSIKEIHLGLDFAEKDSKAKGGSDTDIVKSLLNCEMDWMNEQMQEQCLNLEKELQAENNIKSLMVQKTFTAKKKQKSSESKAIEDKAISEAEVDFDQEEADLLALLGDEGEDYWWEESLTRDIVAETEGTSDWDALAKEQKRIKDEILKRQEEERNKLQDELLSEEKNRIEEMKAEDEEKIRQRAMELDGLTAEQIRDSNLETVKQLRNRLERERESNKQRLKEELQKKLQVKMNDLKLKQQLEILKEEADQVREKEKMQVKKAPEIERKVLKKLLESGKVPPRRLGEAIQKAFSIRHNREMEDLYSKQGMEIADALKKGLDTLQEKKDAARMQLLEELHNSGADEQVMNEAMEKLNQSFSEQQDTLKHDIRSKFKEPHNAALKKLRLQQLQEVSSAYKELVPENIQIEYGEFEKQRLARVMQEFESSLLSQDEQDKASLERKKMEDSIRKKQEAELHKMEREHEARMKREQEEASRRLEAKRQELLKEQMKLQEQRLKEVGEMDDTARQNILDEFKRDRERIEKTLEREKERQLAAVNDMLEKRRLRMQRIKKMAEKKQESNDDNGDSSSADKIWDSDAKVDNLKGIKANIKVGQTDEDFEVSEKQKGESDEDYLKRIEEEFKKNELKQTRQIEADKAKLHKKLAKRRKEAKKKKLECEQAKKRLEEATDEAEKLRLEEELAKKKVGVEEDEKQLKKMQEDYKHTLEIQNAQQAKNAAKRKEMLKRRREKLREKQKLKSPVEDEPDISNDKVAQSKSLMTRLNDVEEAIKKLLLKKPEKTNKMEDASKLSIDDNVLPKSIQGTSLANHIDNLQNLLLDSDDENDYEVPSTNAIILSSNEEKDRIDGLIDDQISELDKLKKSLALEDDSDRRKALEEQIAAEEKRLNEIKTDYEKSQEQYFEQLENQQGTQKERLRKRREALRIKRGQRSNAEKALKEKKLEMNENIQNLEQQLIGENDLLKKQEIEGKIGELKANLVDFEKETEENINELTSSINDDEANLSKIESEYERGLLAAENQLSAEKNKHHAKLEARKKKREEARAKLNKKHESLQAKKSKLLDEQSEMQSDIEQLEKTLATTEGDEREKMQNQLNDKKEEYLNKLKLDAKIIDEAEASLKMDEEHAKEIEEQFAQASDDYNKMISTENDQRKERLKLRREKARAQKEKVEEERRKLAKMHEKMTEEADEKAKRKIQEQIEAQHKKIAKEEEELKQYGNELKDIEDAYRKRVDQHNKNMENEGASHKAKLARRREMLMKKRQALKAKKVEVEKLREAVMDSDDGAKQKENQQLLSKAQKEMEQKLDEVNQDESNMQADLNGLKQQLSVHKNNQRKRLSELEETIQEVKDNIEEVGTEIVDLEKQLSETTDPNAKKILQKVLSAKKKDVQQMQNLLSRLLKDYDKEQAKANEINKMESFQHQEFLQIQQRRQRDQEDSIGNKEAELQRLAIAKALAKDEQEKARLEELAAFEQKQLEKIQTSYTTSVESSKASMKREAAKRKEKLRLRRMKAKKKKRALEDMKDAASKESDAAVRKELERQIKQVERNVQSTNAEVEDIEKSHESVISANEKTLKDEENRRAALLKERRSKLLSQRKKLEKKQGNMNEDQLKAERERLHAAEVEYDQSINKQNELKSEQQRQQNERLRLLREQIQEKKQSHENEKEQLERLKDELASETDPDRRDELSNRIQMQQDKIEKELKEIASLEEEYNKLLDSQQQQLSNQAQEKKDQMKDQEEKLESKRKLISEHKNKLKQMELKAEEELEKLKKMEAEADEKMIKEIEERKKNVQEKLAREAAEFANSNQELAEIEQQFKKSEAEHNNVLRAEESRRKDKLRHRREQMKAKRAAMLAQQEEKLRKEKEVKALEDAVKKAKSSKERKDLQTKSSILKESIKKQDNNISEAAKNLKKMEKQYSDDRIAIFEQMKIDNEKRKTTLKNLKENLPSKVKESSTLENTLSALRRKLLTCSEDEKVVIKSNVVKEEASLTLANESVKRDEEDINDIEIAIKNFETQVQIFNLQNEIESTEKDLDHKEQKYNENLNEIEDKRYELQKQAVQAKLSEPNERAKIEFDIKQSEGKLATQSNLIEGEQKILKKLENDLDLRYNDVIKKRKELLEARSTRLKELKLKLLSLNDDGEAISSAIPSTTGNERQNLEHRLKLQQQSKSKTELHTEQLESYIRNLEDAIAHQEKEMEQRKSDKLQRDRERVRFKKEKMLKMQADIEEIKMAAMQTKDSIERQRLEKLIKKQEELAKSEEERTKKKEELLQKEMQKNKDKLKSIEDEYNATKLREQRQMNAEEAKRKERLRKRREDMLARRKKQRGKVARAPEKNSIQNEDPALPEDAKVKVAALDEREKALDEREKTIDDKLNDLKTRERKLKAMEQKLAAKKKMMQLEKNMKTKAFEKKKNQLQSKAKELEAIESNNKLERDRLKGLQEKARVEKEKLEQQRAEMEKLEQMAENETDEGKKRRMTVQIRQFANKFQSAERKVKRMEEEYTRSVKSHDNKMKAEELRRKEKLRMRREMLKTRRKMRNGRPTKKNTISTLGAIDEPTLKTEEGAEVFTLS